MIDPLARFRRRRRLKNIAVSGMQIRSSLKQSLVFLSVIFTLHVCAMLYYEGMSFHDALWLTLTTATTVGYGDVSAATVYGRAATVLLLYVGGIFVLAKSAGDYFDYRSAQRDKKIKGYWRWDLSEHIVIMNTPMNKGEQYLVRLIQQFRASEKFRETPIQILTSEFPNGLPESIKKLTGVVHYQGRADDVNKVRAVNVDAATAIVVLAKNENDIYSDGRTFDILHRLAEIGVKNTILAECSDDSNRERLLAAGASTVIRPIRAYPEMIVRALVAPGSELIIENMFTSHRDEYVRYNTNINNMPWAQVVCTLVKDDLGTAIAYIDKQTAELNCNPPANTLINASAIFMMVRDQHRPPLKAVEKSLADESIKRSGSSPHFS